MFHFPWEKKRESESGPAPETAPGPGLLVLCVPVGGFPAGTGPGRGSELRDCGRCGKPVWVGPGNLDELARLPAPPTFVCLACFNPRGFPG